MNRNQYRIEYLGKDPAGQRTYSVSTTERLYGESGEDRAVVTEIDGEGWVYHCSCAHEGCAHEGCAHEGCWHIEAVHVDRDEFEAADRKMGDATP